jgi:hypothetical protein
VISNDGEASSAHFLAQAKKKSHTEKDAKKKSHKEKDPELNKADFSAINIVAHFLAWAPLVGVPG